jgi:AbrB family looped-hinge helix DNA binding protein
MPRERYYSSVSPKGQITLPAEVRRRLGIKVRDEVAIEVEDEIVRVVPVRSRLLAHAGIAGSLGTPLGLDEMAEIAADDHAERVAREGIE